MAGHLILVDSSGFAHRAYHALPPRYRSDGLPTWATLGFLSLLWRMLGAAEADRPTIGAAVFDAPGANFRHKLYPAYKAHRREKQPELTAQMPYLRHAAEVIGLQPVEQSGYEADDVIATLAARAKAAGIRTTIISADKDFHQSVEDDVVEIVNPMAKDKSKARVTRQTVIDRWGVTPEQFVDFQALRGDDVDGIPGIPGIGDIEAAKLIRRFKTYKAVIKNADKIQSPGIRMQIKKRQKDAHLSYKLALLRTDVPLEIDLSALTIERPQIEHLRDFLRIMEATSQITAIFGLDRQLCRVVEKDGDPFEWWREELAAPGQKAPDLPQCGFYQTRLIPRGAKIPARIWRENELDIVTAEPTGREILMCEVNGMRKDPFVEWSRLWTNPVSEDDYRFEVADCDHARRWRPGDPKATPNKPADLMAVPPPKNPMRKNP